MRTEENGRCPPARAGHFLRDQVDASRSLPGAPPRPSAALGESVLGGSDALLRVPGPGVDPSQEGVLISSALGHSNVTGVTL
jgi:hypothetical protein